LKREQEKCSGPFLRWDVVIRMSLGFIAAGVVICLFGMIALMPSFDGKWDA
jgi:hypothetical protein